MMDLSKDFWNERYKSNETGWDIGYPSPPICKYIDSLKNKDLRILIPGCGNAYEAEYLLNKGFKNVFVLDISELALANFISRFPAFPESQILLGDFFDLDEKFDLIIEQTFFCALDPALRWDYVRAMHKTLNENGHLCGLLFNDKLNEDKPPFGGSKPEYEELFTPYFEILSMDTAFDSIPPRAGRELFIELKKK